MDDKNVSLLRIIVNVAYFGLLYSSSLCLYCRLLLWSSITWSK